MTIHHILALAAVTLFYAAYLQRQFALRRRGIRTDRLGKGQKERKTRIVEVVLLVVSFSMPVAQYGSILTDWGCVAAPEWLGWTGVAVAFGGVVFFLLAVVAMRDNWRAGIDASQKTELVTRGVYRISRNPAGVRGVRPALRRYRFGIPESRFDCPDAGRYRCFSPANYGRGAVCALYFRD